MRVAASNSEKNDMNTRLLICVTLILFAALDGISQRQATGATWKAPRTPDGQPDLQGIWTNANLTPLQRPAELGDKQFFTEQEAKVVVAAAELLLGAVDEDAVAGRVSAEGAVAEDAV